MLARLLKRERELAIRMSLGASRWRIVRQLLAESLVLALAAGALGTLIAFAGVRALVALQPPNLPRMSTVAVDSGVLAFALGVAVVTAVMLGLITAARTSPTRLREWLNEGQRTMAGGKGERTRQALVVAQVALTIVLLVGAGLLARSFARVLAVNPGYSTANALILDMTGTFPADPGARRRRLDNQRDILAAVERLPGVESAGLISGFPLGNAGNFANGRFLEMTRPDEIASMADVARLGDQAKVRAGFADWRIASAGYFKAMSIPLVRGRLFEESDGPDAPHVAVISESLARAKWPDQDPIGRFIQFGNMDGDLRGFRIVGIVGDVREISPETLPGPIFYGYYQQRPTSRVAIVVKSTTPAALTTAARQVVRTVDPEVPLQIRTVEGAFDRALEGRRFSLLLIGVFSACALLLATLGVYGLMAYLVSQRTHEIGIRLALGAEATDVIALIVGRGVWLAVIGVTIGSVGALALTRLLDGMLFGVSATDPIAFASVIGLTLMSVLAATWVPARRALQVAPVVALRAD
jgi:predicted permease